MKTKIGILASILMIGIVAMAAGTGTLAYFDDEETSTGNTFTAGVLDISLNPATYSADIGNMQPGKTETVSVTVCNIGTLPVVYTISALVSGGIMLGENGGLDDPYVSATRVDTSAYSNPESLSVSGGGDACDDVEVDITLPSTAGNHYQTRSGNIDIVFSAGQQ